MPETTKREYTAQSKSQPVNTLGPKSSKGKNDRWATDARTRGKKAPDGPKSWNCESTLKSFTKLPNLKRGR